ncbi:MAG: beta-ketoacyl-[acyl-carrier-protein] synthase family protein [Gemmataceae bacterium]|nr:beta-ketoacyl-[acyl-carrier-protein] synthase family protein [Gemmataceae bacterium]
MAPSRRAVITGCGMLTPIGSEASVIWDALTHGRSGIAPISAFDSSRLPCRIAGEIPDFNPRKHLDNKVEHEKSIGKSLKLMARTIQLGLIAAKYAMRDAGLQRGSYEPTRFGIVFGSAMIAIEVNDIVGASQAATAAGDGSVDLLRWGESGIDTIEPTWMLKFLPNMAACHISVMYDLQGPSNSITQDDVASLNALGEAYRHIGRGQADAFLVGGADSKISLLSMARHQLFLPLSRRNDDPAGACRPFDRDRDGMVLGEGATVLVVEEREAARRRGARVLAELVGFASTFDARQDGTGLARAIQLALTEAGIAPDDLDHVNAHGLGVGELDQREANAVRQALGASADRVPVFAAKGAIGNMGPAAGVTEVALSLLAGQHGQLPPTLNCPHPDPACPVRVHAAGLRPLEKPYFLKIGFTDLGQCAAVVFRRGEA